ncbi:hypothetical protein B0H14DRAFT_487726 [Mycena olivaceomarginata]|nr:hypothetical protein B0H14DRAFT_487726 [Mycena olivaceomarginata]
MSLSTFPNSLKLDSKPFIVAIPDADVAELKSLLKASRLGPSTPTNSNPSDHSLGVSMDWLKAAKQTWETSFDWNLEVLCIKGNARIISTASLASHHLLAIHVSVSSQLVERAACCCRSAFQDQPVLIRLNMSDIPIRLWPPAPSAFLNGPQCPAP